MGLRMFWLYGAVLTAGLIGTLTAQEKEFSIGEGIGREVTLPITISSPGEVEGFSLSVAFDTSKITAEDVRAAGETLLNDAEVVEVQMAPNAGFTFGVIMDFSPPYEGQVIPPGEDKLIAEADFVSQITPAAGEEAVVPVRFQDGLSDPPLSNTMVIGGMSFTAEEGLKLDDGQVTVPGVSDTLRIVDTEGEAGELSLTVPVEVDNQRPVEGYVLCIKNPSKIALTDITTKGTDASNVGIEFDSSSTYPDGGTIQVVFDFLPVYDGQTLPPGEGRSLARFVYSHDPMLPVVVPGDNAVTFELEFVDNYFGDPPLSNVLTESGLQVSPELENGTVTFLPPLEGEKGVDFYAGADIGEAYCEEDTEIPPAEGIAGSEVKVCLYYASDLGPVQGISMALNYPAGLSVLDLDNSGYGTVQDKHLEGTMTDMIEAEFVSFNADNDSGELIVGILVEANPPLPISHMFPMTMCPRKVLNVFFSTPEEEGCGHSYGLVFEDELTGAGSAPITNTASVFNQSIPASTHDGSIRTKSAPVFIRGDCNWDKKIDIADPVGTMYFLLTGKPVCMDACDSNDDGVVDLADVMTTLRYLFQNGPVLPDPGPFPPGGVDPTPDAFGLDLGCEAGDPCSR